MTSDGAQPAWLREITSAVSQLPAHQLSSLQRPPGGTPRSASVLILFGQGSRGAELLLLERAADMRQHAGQVSFPGGGQDDGDADAVAAALREAAEETGLDPGGVDVVAVLPPRWLPITDFMVTPVIGWWRQRVPVQAVDPGETAAVHVVPVDALLDPLNRGRVRHPSGYVGPAFKVGSILVWGFTADFLSRLFALAKWDREWDPERYFELPAAVRDGSLRDLNRRQAASGLAATDGRLT
jgi:8-oxo-dGTP pyrophosphatase MutT (NUDIX family)